jgi:hypothetical protein
MMYNNNVLYITTKIAFRVGRIARRKLLAREKTVQKMKKGKPSVAVLLEA